MGAISRSTLGTGNLAGILAILFSMASFTVNDALLKLASGRLPFGELVFLRNACATTLLLAACIVLTDRAMPRGLPWGIVGLRVTGEVCATFLYLSALLLLPIADVTAIAQFTPLAITAAAAVFLAEPVGWRRWLATGVGLGGVMLIIRPGSAAFSGAALLVLGSVLFVVLRDLATRQLPPAVSTLLITVVSSAAVTAACLALLPFETWLWPTLEEALMLSVSGVFLIGGYLSIIAAMRSGEISVVSPFRYSVILYALIAGFAIWGEVPDAISLIGIAIVVGAGLYTLQRERRKGPAPLAARLT